MKKFFQTFMISTVLSILCAVSAFAGSWQQDTRGWWYQNDDQSYFSSGWQWIDGDGDGTAECYYFDDQGYCIMDGTTPDGCKVDSKGAWIADNKIQTKTVEQPRQPETQSTQQNETREQITNQKENMVWLSRTGKKYHSNSSCSNMKNSSQVTLSQAQAQGRTPCSKCY